MSTCSVSINSHRGIGAHGSDPTNYGSTTSLRRKADDVLVALPPVFPSVLFNHLLYSPFAPCFFGS